MIPPKETQISSIWLSLVMFDTNPITRGFPIVLHLDRKYRPFPLIDRLRL